MTSEDGRSGGVRKLDEVREICQPPPPYILTLPGFGWIWQFHIGWGLLIDYYAINIIWDETINLFTILYYLGIIVMKNWARISQVTAMHGSNPNTDLFDE